MGGWKSVCPSSFLGQPLDLGTRLLQNISEGTILKKIFLEIQALFSSRWFQLLWMVTCKMSFFFRIDFKGTANISLNACEWLLIYSFLCQVSAKNRWTWIMYPSFEALVGEELGVPHGTPLNLIGKLWRELYTFYTLSLTNRWTMMHSWKKGTEKKKFKKKYKNKQTWKRFLNFSGGRK